MTKILIVDDDSDLRASLARDMRNQAFDVYVAASFDDALVELDRAGGVDVLLTDLRMPDRDGLDLLKTFKERAPRTPTILMSAYATARDYDSALELGSVVVLSKPFSRAELRQAIDRALECTSGFHGQVHGLSLVDVLQMFHFGRRSITVLIGSTGRIVLREGEVVHAVSAELAGEAALRDLITRDAGHMRTTPLSEHETERTIERDFDGLLLESLRQHDEDHRAATDCGEVDDFELEFVELSEDDEPPGPTRLTGEAAREFVERAKRMLEPALVASLPRRAVLLAVAPKANQYAVVRGPVDDVDPTAAIAVTAAAKDVVGAVPSGACWAIGPEIGLALVWDTPADLVLALAEACADPAELAWFRSHAAALARCVSTRQGGRHGKDR